MYMLEVSNLKKVYVPRFGGGKVEALKNVTFTVDEGEYVAVMGESGSGKTTLLNILAALDKPTGGSVLLDGRELVRRRRRGACRLPPRTTSALSFRISTCSTRLTVEDNILPAAGAGREEVHGDERSACALLARTPRDHRHPQKISLRDLRRAEAALRPSRGR